MTSSSSSIIIIKNIGDDKRLGMVASRKKKLERVGMEGGATGGRFKVSYWAGYHDTQRPQVMRVRPRFRVSAGLATHLDKGPTPRR